MGCVSSKESVSRERRVFSYNGLLGLRSGSIRKKQTQKLDQLYERVSSCPNEASESNGIITLGEMLNHDDCPEVIDVLELMDGLSDEEEAGRDKPDSTDIVVGADLCQFSGAYEVLPLRIVEDTSSSSDNALNNDDSPRSPLNFDNDGRCKFVGRYGLNRGTALDTVITTPNRTFSFKFKSSVPSNDQASTPKLILDSTSPLLKPSESDTVPQPIVFEAEIISKDENSEDEELLSAFENILEQLSSDEWLSTRESNADSFDPESPTRKQEVALYYLRNQENHEDCCMLRSILSTYGVQAEERDISTHPDYKYELVHLIDELVPAALFINGRFIGGAEQLVELNRQGQLGFILNPTRCNGCAGVGSIRCLDCNGTRKFVTECGLLKECTECFDGNVRCPLCSR